jgi:antitoxin ParD1/3/4
MARRESISVSFTPEQASFVSRCVSTGRYQSASEVVREALRLLEHQQLHQQAALDRARAMILEGAEQLDRGQVVEGEVFFREWDEELAEIEAAEQRKAARRKAK